MIGSRILKMAKKAEIMIWSRIFRIMRREWARGLFILLPVRPFCHSRDAPGC